MSKDEPVLDQDLEEMERLLEHEQNPGEHPEEEVDELTKPMPDRPPVQQL